MRNVFCFLLSAFCLSITACSFNPNTQGEGEKYLQGEWQQDSTSVQKQLLSYSLYNFKFTCDSFYLRQQTFSKVNNGIDTCSNNGQWYEYMRGTYRQHNDTVFLKGYFTNADYSLKKYGGCFRSGQYEEFFKVKKQADSLVQLTGTTSVLPINLRLTKASTCIVKPL